MIAVIDYGMGNLRSVMNAFHALGEAAQATSDPARLREADAIVLPGVGAFGDGMRQLRQAGFVEALDDSVVRQGKPFLGICLGMQLLATTGLEHGRHAGLGWIPGRVERLPVPPQEPSLRIPHVGWNDVRVLTREGLYEGAGESPVFYFVHSYALQPEDPSVVSGVCAYGVEFAASLARGNIWATQFHPEKSHLAGLSLLRNFANLQRSTCSRSA